MGAVEMSKLIEVGGVAYVVSHQNPTKAFDLGVRLMQIVGEPVAAMSQGAESAEKALAVVPMAMGALMRNIKPGDSISIIKEVLSSCAIREGNNPLLTGATFEDHFKGRVGHLLNVFMEATAFQFEDFFGAIGDAIAAGMKKVQEKQASLSQLTSAGQ